VASKSETDKFVNDTILMLDAERASIKKAAHEDLDRTFALAFQDREAAISGYADWFYEWKRSYVVLKETVSSAITRFFEAGKYESIRGDRADVRITSCAITKAGSVASRRTITRASNRRCAMLTTAIEG
jgi:hypothetical protein